MRFTFDESKRRANLDKHGLDLLEGQSLFDGRPVFTAPSPRGGEDRFLTVGMVEGRVLALVWTWRAEAARLISLRRARREERRQYQALFVG